MSLENSRDERDVGPQLVAHADGDHVAVAIQDLSPGRAHGYVLSSNRSLTVDVVDAVPLGHKISLVDVAEGADVIEYGVRVAVASAPISAGQHVHIHNVRSARWDRTVN